MAKALADSDVSGRIVSFDVLPHEQAHALELRARLDGPRTRAELLCDYAPSSSAT